MISIPSSDPWNDAPGADDNASGVAAVLEAARILSGYEFENTIEFLLLGGEEQGLTGSAENAANARALGKDIRGVVNLDMIGYWPPSHDGELDIGKNSASSWLADVLERATRDYAAITPHNWPDTGVCFDDHVSYWNEGYDAIVLMDCYEAHADPIGSGERTTHYHKTTDTIVTLDLDLTTEAVRATVTGMAELAVPLIAPITMYAVAAASDDVALSWTGGAVNFDVDAATSKDFQAGVTRLTPVDGITDPQWLDVGVLNDGVLYYYQIDRH